ncbi:MAG: NifB/NifX family molybdenum-iron cluster-binding protein [Thermoguttaceae bacterium]
MKIAVTAQGRDLDSPVDPRFGRARAFVVFDTDTGQATVHDNQVNLNALQGAGIQAARMMAQLGVSAVITGHVGPKALAALQAGNLTVYTGATGTVRQAVEAFQAGRLHPADKADVKGHWI